MKPSVTSALRLVRGLALVAFLAALAAGQSQDQSGKPPAQGSSPAPQRVLVTDDVTAGLLVHRVAPAYPKKARKAHLQGVVLMKAVITVHGDIADLQLISGDPILAESAMTAVRQWKYFPYFLRGEAVEVETQIRVNFTLGK